MLGLNSLTSYSKHLQAFIESRLWLKVILAIFVGFGVGLLLSPEFNYITKSNSIVIGSWLGLPGILFMKLVQMIMVPLIIASIIRGLISSNIESLKKLGPSVLVYFLFTTFFSVSLGVFLSSVFKPGSQLDQSLQGGISELPTSQNHAFDFANIPSIIGNILPENPLASMVTGEMMSIVVFAIIVGIAIMGLSQKNKTPIVNLLSSVQEICMIIVKWAMKLVPIAVFGLIAQLTASVGVNSIMGISYYILVVLLGLAILLLFYIMIVQFFGGGSSIKFLKNIRDAQLLAFSTTSSAAVMPLSMKTAEEKLKVHPSISNFLIPLGATINMDGTAIYQCISTIFIAQAYGIELSIMNLILITFTLVTASIGTPAIPGGGAIILASVLGSIGIPIEGLVLIIGVERLLGMFRTAVNVTGDLTACVFFNQRLKNQLPLMKSQKESS